MIDPLSDRSVKHSGGSNTPVRRSAASSGRRRISCCRRPRGRYSDPDGTTVAGALRTGRSGWAGEQNTIGPRHTQTTRKSGCSDRGLALHKPRPSSAAICRRVDAVAKSRGWPVPSYGTVHSIVQALDPAMVTLAQDGPCASRDRFAFEIFTMFRCHIRFPLWQALLARNRNGSESSQPDSFG